MSTVAKGHAINEGHGAHLGEPGHGGEDVVELADGRRLRQPRAELHAGVFFSNWKNFRKWLFDFSSSFFARFVSSFVLFCFGSSNRRLHFFPPFSGDTNSPPDSGLNRFISSETSRFKFIPFCHCELHNFVLNIALKFGIAYCTIPSVSSVFLPTLFVNSS